MVTVFELSLTHSVPESVDPGLQLTQVISELRQVRQFPAQAPTAPEKLLVMLTIRKDPLAALVQMCGEVQVAHPAMHAAHVPRSL
jgi:hypothetical protein